MKTYAQARRFRGHESHWSALLNDEQLNEGNSGDEQPEVSVELSQANRSRDNISTWSAYLPAACVRTMVDMGWDRST